VHGITAAHVAVKVTTTARADGCTPSHATVETLAMAATRDASTVGPLILIVFADRNVPGQVPDGVLRHGEARGDYDQVVETINASDPHGD
jgi:hypothetical protein